MSTGNIFICYRHEDSSAYAGRLADELTRQFGRARVFRDAGSQRGVDFRHQIDDAIDSCAVLVAVIGKKWLMVQDESGRRRIDHPGDLVALEIAAALERDIRVIPVLVAGARMPSEADLPTLLAGLAYRTAIELSDAGWDHQISGLLHDLNHLFGSAAGTSARVASPHPPPGAILAPQDRLDEIHRCIARGTHVAICGAPGIGRTWLLIALHKAYPQAVHVRLEGRSEPMRELRLALHGRYGTPEFPLDDETGLKALRGMVDANTLLLVDSADERESVAAVLRIVHIVGKPTVVVTTQRAREFRAFRRIDCHQPPSQDDVAASSSTSSSNSSETALLGTRGRSSAVMVPAAPWGGWRHWLCTRATAYTNIFSSVMAQLAVASRGKLGYKRRCTQEPGSGTMNEAPSR
jgi:TIR domain-containing protein